MYGTDKAFQYDGCQAAGYAHDKREDDKFPLFRHIQYRIFQIRQIIPAKVHVNVLVSRKLT